tara:strand:+ start:210 stop:1253 length:1044 start_codon:yes stop_codon:yes gene_type:complete
MKNSNYCLLIIFSLTNLFAQVNTQRSLLPNGGDQLEKSLLYREYDTVPFALEGPIDPKNYILGPGDRLRINISGGVFEKPTTSEWSSENIDNYILVDPTGNLIIPRFGSINVLNTTIDNLEKKLNQISKDRVYKNAIIGVNLIRLRSFRILVYGAVNQPGFVTVTPVTRLLDCLRYAKGLNKYANINLVQLIRDDNKLEIDPKSFLVNGNLNSNPIVKEGDKIYIPFNQNVKNEKENLVEYSSTDIIVTGFVRSPKRFAHVTGYTARDYIALAGGTLDIGNEKNSKIIQPDGNQINNALNMIVKPGDIINVPEASRSKLFKNMGAIQSLTSVASLILAWMAIDQRTN